MQKFIYLVIALFLLGCTADTATLTEAPADNTATPTETTETSFITYWLPSELSVNEDSVEIGCGTYITPIATTELASSNAVENVEFALVALFTATAQEPYQNYWLGNTADNIAIDGNQLNVSISGDFTLIGTCGDASILAQILLTVFESVDIETASIMVNGNNLKQISDMSGASGADSVFTEDDIPFTGN